MPSAFAFRLFRLRPRLLTGLLAVGAAGVPAYSTDEGDLARAWALAGQSRFAEAHRLLERNGADAGAERLFAHALVLLNTPPTTEARLDEAARLLSAAAQAPSVTGDLAAAAAYFLARIEGIHRLRPDQPRAKMLYERAWREHSPTRWAQLAALRWLALHLAGIATDEAPADRLMAAENAAPTFVDPSLRKDFHLLMAYAWGRMQPGPEHILDHLLHAESLGIVHAQTRADVYCAIGNHALALGRTPLSLEFFQRYLREFQRDARRHHVASLVEGLRALPSP